MPSVWYAGVPGGSWLDGLGETIVYSNPYFVVPPTTLIAPPALDYSVPLPTPSSNELDAYPPAAEGQTNAESLPAPQDALAGTVAPPTAAATEQMPAANEARQEFDSAREAFKRGVYPLAQQLAEKAIQQLPSDAVLHEFRALTLFAQGRYADASAALYAVLSAGPGWDWETMSALYPDRDEYTRQLRALEDYIRKNPAAGNARFLLTYHYLVLGYHDQAVKQLEEVVRRMPNDRLSAELLKSLTKGAASNSDTTPRPAPGGQEPIP